MTSLPASGSRWRHWKGTIYKVIGTGLDSETKEPVVIYRALDNDFAETWVRPLSEWEHQVTASKKRFECLDFNRYDARKPPCP